jgi:hypothetical protein
MITLQKLDNIAVIFMIILGIIFFTLSITVFKTLDNNCPSKTVKTGWIFIQVFGLSMVMLGVSFFICTLRSSASCYSGVSDTRSAEFYFATFGVLALVIFGMAISIVAEYDKLSSDDKGVCDPKGNMKQLGTFIAGIAGLVIVISIGFFVKIHMEGVNEVIPEPLKTEF